MCVCVCVCVWVRVCVCVCVCVCARARACNQLLLSFFTYMTFAVNITDGHGLRNEERRDLLPKKSKV